MGLLDSAMDMLRNNPPGAMEPRTRLMQAALALLADNGQTGGLRGLVERFEEAGLGNVVQSWIGTGENVPITTEQLHQVLGEGQIAQVAEETGMDEHQAAQELSETLPKLVDTVTPAGHIPAGGLGNMSALLDHFIGRFL
jgi:uncharacterized protein YidB (DUF937 family)